MTPRKYERAFDDYRDATEARPDEIDRVRDALRARSREQRAALEGRSPRSDPFEFERPRQLPRGPVATESRSRWAIGVAVATVAVAAATLWLTTPKEPRPAPPRPEAPVTAEGEAVDPGLPERRSPGRSSRSAASSLAAVDLGVGGLIEETGARRALMTHAASVTGCARRAGPGAQATVSADRFGRPTRFAPGDPSDASATFARCLEGRLGALALPPASGVVAGRDDAESAMRVHLRVRDAP